MLCSQLDVTVLQPIVATKFAPLPWRLTADSVPLAAQASLRRLQMTKLGLYIIHWWVVVGCGWIELN